MLSNTIRSMFPEVWFLAYCVDKHKVASYEYGPKIEALAQPRGREEPWAQEGTHGCSPRANGDVSVSHWRALPGNRTGSPRCSTS